MMAAGANPCLIRRELGNVVVGTVGGLRAEERFFPGVLFHMAIRERNDGGFFLMQGAGKMKKRQAFFRNQKWSPTIAPGFGIDENEKAGGGLKVWDFFVEKNGRHVAIHGVVHRIGAETRNFRATES